MNNIQIFKYENNDVRTVEINGEPWFVLKDVCGVLAMDVSKIKQVLTHLANISAPDMHITTGLLQLNALQKEKHYER